ncbi:hypothetical protein FACS1894206_08660 [Deltaproteobacteria bacterium]|nr:hypothetical protein FACS1894206_08660 [Deltaproteobacteria bacterium]
MPTTISVVIPVYNRADKISRCLRSIVEQTVAASEIIIVDDASSDNICMLLARDYPSVRVIRHEHNLGAQAARAAGIRAATGEWIAFLDSDDWWLPQKLEWQLEKAAEGFSVVHGPGLVSINGQEQPFPVPSLEGDVYRELLRTPGSLYPCLLIRRECFEKAGYPDPGISAMQEWDMSLLLARHYPFGYVDKPLFVYEVQGDSISKDEYRGMRGYEQVVNKWWSEILRVAGKDAGFEHYRRLAVQACGLTGIFGYAHYARLGAERTNRSFIACLAAGAGLLLSSAKHALGKKLPWLRALWRLVLRKQDKA